MRAIVGLFASWLQEEFPDDHVESRELDGFTRLIVWHDNSRVACLELTDESLEDHSPADLLETLEQAHALQRWKQQPGSRAIVCTDGTVEWL